MSPPLTDGTAPSTRLTGMDNVWAPSSAADTGHRGAKAHVTGVRNATQKAYSDRKTAEAVPEGLSGGVHGAGLEDWRRQNGLNEEERGLIASMANVSLQT